MFPEQQKALNSKDHLETFAISDDDDIYACIIYGTPYTYISFEYFKCINSNFHNNHEKCILPL